MYGCGCVNGSDVRTVTSRHTPALQVAPVHPAPQAPQFDMSLNVSTQVPLQKVKPGGQQ